MTNTSKKNCDTNTDNILTKSSILKIIEKNDIKFIRLQFSDMFGKVKNVVVPARRIEAIIDNNALFDGSSVDGFVRIEESDMYLKPDLSTFVILPEEIHQGKSARFICDVYQTNGEAFLGDPRQILKRVLSEATSMGFNVCNVGPEMEFYLLQTDEHNKPLLEKFDKGSYFDLGPDDIGELARQNMMTALENMGFNVEMAHHENGSSQHEIDFHYTDALKAADQVMTFKYVVKACAASMSLHSTFMPKPFFGEAGSGMHCNISLEKNGSNVFFDESDELGLSIIAKQFLAGIMSHAKAITAITNPTVNSYKRLVPDFEAPCYIAWSAKNRSPLVRVPTASKSSVRLELRSPDPSCNPYLAFAVILAAGLDGIKNKLDLCPSVNENIFAMHEAKRRMLNIEALPKTIDEALRALSEDKVILDCLGEHISTQFSRAKSLEWKDYNQKISQWEIDRYLDY